MAEPNITLLGATYNGVKGVTLPKSGGGTATFPWVEGSETKTANGTYDVTNLAQIIVNVAGGGGSGLVYETGIYKPTADIARPTISFANTHQTAPFAVLIVDISNTTTSSNSNLVWGILSWYNAFGSTYVSGSYNYYSRTMHIYRTSSSTTAGGYSQSTLTGSGTSAVEYNMTASAFYPYSGSASRYWRKNVSYQWIAVWKP